jgi:K+-transporting ATPase c subunit
MTELFEGRLIKNGKVQKNFVPSRYYWGRCCKEGTLEDYPSFEISYRTVLNTELRKNLNASTKSYKKETNENGVVTITIGFDGVYTDGSHIGEQISISVEFYKKDGVIALYAIDIPSRITE